MTSSQYIKSPLLIITYLLLIVSITSATMLPPFLSTNHRQLTVKEGETSVVLECSLDVGDDPISYKWLKNFEWVTGTLGYSYRGFQKLLLALHTIRLDHAGVYVCEATNDAGVHTEQINVIVEPDPNKVKTSDAEKLLPEDILSDFAASLSDLLAEGDCQCDIMFLLHASRDAPSPALAAQANFAYIIGNKMISDKMRISVMTYSTYVTKRMSFGQGTNRCALKKAFENVSHPMWATNLHPVLRDIYKKYKKSKSTCKVLLLPVFGSSGENSPYLEEAKKLKNANITVMILEVTPEPTNKLIESASYRGDGKPYYWHIPLPIWLSIVDYMPYMEEEMTGCMLEETPDIPGVCVGEGSTCSSADQCHGIGMGCIEGSCQSLNCKDNPRNKGCCTKSNGDFWCGDVTGNCTLNVDVCDGRIQCMNGADEEQCWSRPCPTDKVSRCQSSTLCLALYDLCDGVVHCPGGEDEDPRFCRAYPCPVHRPFRCNSGKCIEKEQLCDGAFMDCPEGEDESLGYCSRVHSCPLSAPFKCDYGICLKMSSRCNNVYNCLDASDELSCDTVNCPADRPFKCTNGKCVGLSKICNGVIDSCSDGSDEKNCQEFVCPHSRSYKCNNGRCINSWLECDQFDDCGDNSDEVNCGHTSTTPRGPRPAVTSTTPRGPRPAVTSSIIPSLTPINPCKRNEFHCASGACLPSSMVCDGRNHCADRDDENNCEEFQCPKERPHRCLNFACVKVYLCDGIPDCTDTSDEMNCTTVPTEDEDSGKNDDWDENNDFETDNRHPDLDMIVPSITVSPKVNIKTTTTTTAKIADVERNKITDTNKVKDTKPKEDEDIYYVDHNAIPEPDIKPDTPIHEHDNHHEHDTQHNEHEQVDDTDDMITVLEEHVEPESSPDSSINPAASTDASTTLLISPSIVTLSTLVCCYFTWIR